MTDEIKDCDVCEGTGEALDDEGYFVGYCGFCGDEKTKVAKLKDRYLKKLRAEFKSIPPRDFISFEVLKPHLPVMFCGGGEMDEDKLNEILDSIALELIVVYNNQLTGS